MSKTKFTDVYLDKNGKYFYQVELGIDATTGKRIQRKGRKDKNGRLFESANDANKEVIRLKNEYMTNGAYSNYQLTYDNFMGSYYMPHYQADVERSTWGSRECGLIQISKRFKDIELRKITVSDCEKYRTWLLTKSGYSQSYAALMYGMFRKSLDYAVTLNFVNENISKKTKAIAKGKSIVLFWTKEQFEKVLETIYTDDFYEHMSFVMIWLYYMTGIRVSEGLALTWNDVDLKRGKLLINHTLDMQSRDSFVRKPYTKTESGMRTISLDRDTIKVLCDWKQVQQEHGVENFIMSYTDMPLHRSTVAHIVKRYAKLAKVPLIQAKGLRHSHVSYLINEFNADILVVSKRLGHSSPEITLKHYAHLWSRNDEGLAEEMTGNIVFKFAKKSRIAFNGNQVVKK